MTTPNFNPKITTITSNNDVADDDSIAKKASPQSTKEFRKILDKDDDKDGKDDEGDQIKKKPTETTAGEKTVAVDTASAAAVVVSLFDLPKASTTVSTTTTTTKADPSVVAEAVTSPTDVNIFNLNKKHKTKPLTNPHALGHHMVEASDQSTESPSSLYAKMNTKTTNIKPEEDLVPDEVITDSDAGIKSLKSSLDDATTTKFVAEASESTTKKPVRSSNLKTGNDEQLANYKEEGKGVVNPPIAQVNFDLSGVTTNAEVAKPNPVPAVLKEVVDKLVTGLQTLSYDGQTQTTITLNDPDRPDWMFNGMQIVVTEFDSASGQLNIAFENLSQQAQNFLAARSVQASLVMTLERQGYVVQNITPTPIIEHPILVDQTESGEKGKSGRQQQGQGNQQQQKHTA